MRNELCSVWFMSFDKIEFMMCMPQIEEKVTLGERFVKRALHVTSSNEK